VLNVRTVTDLARTIATNIHRVDRRQFDVVVGIPRSGMLPASIIATHLQLPLSTPEAYAAGIVHGRSGSRVSVGSRILLVDDSCNKGRAFKRASAVLPKAAKIVRLAVFGPYQVDPASVCDLWFETVPGPRAFAWNMNKHIRLPRWGFDFDGVLCRDNTKAENDDGPRYARFLSEAEPLFLPQRPIGPIVTGRLEKYRGETTDWLRRHGIQFESLTMMQFATKAERMAHGGRGQWKAEQAMRLGVEFFIESCPKQAAIIAREAGIGVFCTSTQAVA
jgi:hypothetical protein